MDPNKHMLKNVSDFKRRVNDFNRNLRYASSVFIIAFIAIFLDGVVFPPLSYIYLVVVLVCTTIFVALASILKKNQPSFTEYLLYYFWMGNNYLDKYENKGASDKDLKDAISFFKKLDNLLFEGTPWVKIYRFEIEKAINNSIEWLEKWTSKFVLKSLKKRKTDIYQQVDEVFNKTFEFLLDEKFIELRDFLNSYVASYVIKSKNPLVKFFKWLRLSRKRCILFYGTIAIVVLAGITYTLYIKLGFDFVYKLYSIIFGIVFCLSLVISYINKKYFPDKTSTKEN